MAHPEFTHRPELKGFQDKITYARPDLAPRQVATRVNSVMASYFSPLPYSPDILEAAKEPLLQGVELLHNVRKGLKDNPRVVDRIGVASQEQIEKLKDMHTKDQVPYDEAQEALRFSLIALGLVQNESRTFVRDEEGNYLVYTYSRDGIMATPVTIDEVLRQIEKTAIQTWQVSEGMAPRAIRLFQNPELARTQKFWEKCSELAQAI
ncbi:MAG: hypothetical protein KA035_03955 [Candidatus Levybacteria bacterium]|nr:hypothetical protein [Candidatus Levybacteria bacterium]